MSSILSKRLDICLLYWALSYFRVFNVGINSQVYCVRKLTNIVVLKKIAEKGARRI